MNFVKKLWLLPVLAFVLASCNSENNGNTITQQFSTGFVNVVDSSTGESYVDSDISYEMTFDYDNMLAEVNVSGLQLSSSGSNISFSLKGLTWSYTEDGYRQIYAPNVQLGMNTTISNFRLTMIDRNIYVSGQYAYYPIISISYVVDDRYSVTTFMRSYVYLDNATRVTTVATGDVYTPKAGTLYGVSFNFKDKTASLLIDGAVFAAGMEAHPVQMTFPKLAFTVNANGFTLTCQETIPEVTEGGKQVPYEAFKITDFTGYFSLSGSSSLNYRCANRENPCDVTTELDYFSKKTGN